MLAESRDLQLVDGFVEARRGVDVGPEAHADGLEVADELVFREARGPVERHVLEEVGEPALVVILEDRARVHDEPELGALLGLGVLADVVAKAVRQRPNNDARIARQGRRARGVDRRCRWPQGNLASSEAVGRNDAGGNYGGAVGHASPVDSDHGGFPSGQCRLVDYYGDGRRATGDGRRRSKVGANDSRLPTQDVHLRLIPRCLRLIPGASA